MFKQLTTAFLIVLVAFAAAAAKDDKTQPPIKQLGGVSPARSVFKATTRGKPIVIKSEKDAAKHFAGDDLAKLKKQVDFKKQIVLVFAWRGSGQDRLTFNVAKSFPEQIFFRLKPGRTRDLRSHLKVYVLRSNVKWKVG
ncbi:MAG: hypothetical protein IIA67_10170 [Planctomycetes bacterium]|nr:hypothetical protein [Planctomycetota bacterium]